MNVKLIVFSGIVTAIVGSGVGVVAAGLFPSPYRSEMYQDLDRKYAVVGAVSGLLIGSCQEMIRQAKRERDDQELMEELKKVTHSRRS